MAAEVTEQQGRARRGHSAQELCTPFRKDKPSSKGKAQARAPGAAWAQDRAPGPALGPEKMAQGSLWAGGSAQSGGGTTGHCARPNTPDGPRARALFPLVPASSRGPLCQGTRLAR